MTTYYVDTSMPTDGTGTIVNPYNTLASVTTADNDTVLIKTGTTLVRNPAGLTFYPALFLSKNNLTFGEYGTGAKPSFNGGVLHQYTDFVQDGVVWYLQFTALYSVTNRMGNISEDGLKMNFYTWVSLADAKTNMIDGQYTIDFTNNRIYIKPTGGSITGRSYISSEITHGLREDTIAGTSTTGLTVRNLEFTRLSGHGGVLGYKTNARFIGVEFNYIGGFWNTAGTIQAGNGLELTAGCSNIQIEDFTANDIFDSAFTAQVYELTKNSIEDISLSNASIARCGLSGIELSCPQSATGTYQTVKNVNVSNVVISDIAPNSSGSTRWDYNWSGYRGGYALNLTNNGGATNKISGCNIHDVTITNAFRMAATKDTYDINRFWNISGNNITDTNTVSSTSTDGQAHQYTNFSDNLARTPSGIGKWVSTSGIALPTRTILSR